MKEFPIVFAIRNQNNIKLVSVDIIVHFEGSGAYSDVFFSNGKKATICGNLSSQLKRVEFTGLFVRIHRSHIINRNYISSIDNYKWVTLLCGTCLSISSSYKEDFLASLNIV